MALIEGVAAAQGAVAGAAAYPANALLTEGGTILAPISRTAAVDRGGPRLTDLGCLVAAAVRAIVGAGHVRAALIDAFLRHDGTRLARSAADPTRADARARLTRAVRVATSLGAGARPAGRRAAARAARSRVQVLARLSGGGAVRARRTLPAAGRGRLPRQAFEPVAATRARRFIAGRDALVRHARRSRFRARSARFAPRAALERRGPRVARIADAAAEAGARIARGQECHAHVGRRIARRVPPARAVLALRSRRAALGGGITRVAETLGVAAARRASRRTRRCDEGIGSANATRNGSRPAPAAGGRKENAPSDRERGPHLHGPQ